MGESTINEHSQFFTKWNWFYSITIYFLWLFDEASRFPTLLKELTGESLHKLISYSSGLFEAQKKYKLNEAEKSEKRIFRFISECGTEIKIFVVLGNFFPPWPFVLHFTCGRKCRHIIAMCFCSLLSDVLNNRQPGVLLVTPALFIYIRSRQGDTFQFTGNITTAHCSPQPAGVQVSKQ